MNKLRRALSNFLVSIAMKIDPSNKVVHQHFEQLFLAQMITGKAITIVDAAKIYKENESE